MQVQLVLALAAGFLASAPPKADTSKDAQAIQGTWIIEAAERDGKADNDVKGGKLSLKDGNLVMTTKNDEQKAAYKLDPTKKPRTIDVTPAGEPTIQGIYELDGDRLKICITKEKGRPSEFNGKGDNMLLVLKRQKK